MNKILIGIGSKAKVGKDTLGLYLSKQYSLKRLAFADPLKEEVNTMLQSLGLTYDDANKDVLRPLLIGWGESRRKMEPDYWVSIIEKQYKNTMSCFGIAGCGFYHGVVITDVRYVNEAMFIRNNGGVLINIIRDNGMDIPTEHELDNFKFDYTIHNNASLEDLLHAGDDVIKGRF
jgi:hypothetical protein